MLPLERVDDRRILLMVQNCDLAHSIKSRVVQNCDVARERVKDRAIICKQASIGG